MRSQTTKIIISNQLSFLFPETTPNGFPPTRNNLIAIRRTNSDPTTTAHARTADTGTQQRLGRAASAGRRARPEPSSSSFGGRWELRSPPQSSNSPPSLYSLICRLDVARMGQSLREEAWMRRFHPNQRCGWGRGEGGEFSSHTSSRTRKRQTQTPPMPCSWFWRPGDGTLGG
jgi:hypothetical protein